MNVIDTVETGFKPVSTKPVSADNGADMVKPDKQTNHGLSEFVRAFKTFSSRRINAIRQTAGCKVWQSRFHDRIIRNEPELNKTREYIINNPLNWETDENYRV